MTDWLTYLIFVHDYDHDVMVLLGNVNNFRFCINKTSVSECGVWSLKNKQLVMEWKMMFAGVLLIKHICCVFA